jgi:Ser/Thr protein kinase RdoA (MazF antagonist)
VLDLARDAISRWRTPPPGHDAAGLRGLLLSQLDEIEARWRVIAAICSSAPRTLVHGDLCAQNMYVTASASGEPTLLPVDWEETGYGPPAVDLAQLLPGHVHFAAGADLAAYASAMQDVWPSLDPATVHLLSTAGTIFRAIAAIRWATQSVTDEWWRDGEVDELRVYGSVVEHALVQLDSPT